MYRLMILLLAIGLTVAAQAGPLTYQGQLQDSSGLVDDQVDIVFELYDQDEGGSAMDTDVHNDVMVSDGLFQVELDFGSGVFDGGERWLQVIVDGQELDPRQPITAAPLAVHALSVPVDSLADDFWRLGGNVNTDSISDFLGTADDQPFEIGIGGQRMLRLERSEFDGGQGLLYAPNWIAGHPQNEVGDNAAAATIGGGGADGAPNVVDWEFSTISGGLNNLVNNSGATIGGEQLNVAEGFMSTIGGGGGNVASGTSATVPGGQSNEAGGRNSFAAGRRAKAENNGTFVWADDTSADFTSTGLNQFLIRAGGGVGINTNNPGSFDLAVDGTAAKPGGGSWSTFSDARLKQNIQPVSTIAGSLLERLLELNAYFFEYTDEAVDTRLGMPGKQIGLLAQEVKEVFPEWVDTDEEGFLYVTERGTTAIMVEALRELTDRHDRQSDSHDQQLAELRSENAELREVQDEQLAELRAENAELREQVEANSKLGERNAELEDRLATLETLFLEDRRIVESLK